MKLGRKGIASKKKTQKFQVGMPFATASQVQSLSIEEERIRLEERESKLCFEHFFFF
jgi:hypothetical protein